MARIAFDRSGGREFNAVEKLRNIVIGGARRANVAASRGVLSFAALTVTVQNGSIPSHYNGSRSDVGSTQQVQCFSTTGPHLYEPNIGGCAP
jgi:hypothetical protein